MRILTAASGISLLTVLLAACGSEPRGPSQQQSTVDKSCGLDCDAQAHYGLKLSTCFEYTTQYTGVSNPADLGVLVKGVGTLENDVRVIDLEYRQSGQILMTDSVRLTGGDLQLARREGDSGSFTYENASGEAVGVTWLRRNTEAGALLTSEATVDAIVASGRTHDAVSYRVNVVQPDGSEDELKVPAGAYASGLKLLMTEEPAQQADPLRIFVPNVGFIRFSSKLGGDGPYQTFRLQKVYVADSEDLCGLGSP